MSEKQFNEIKTRLNVNSQEELEMMLNQCINGLQKVKVRYDVCGDYFSPEIPFEDVVNSIDDSDTSMGEKLNKVITLFSQFAKVCQQTN